MRSERGQAPPAPPTGPAPPTPQHIPLTFVYTPRRRARGLATPARRPARRLGPKRGAGASPGSSPPGASRGLARLLGLVGSVGGVHGQLAALPDHHLGGGGGGGRRQLGQRLGRQAAGRCGARAPPAGDAAARRANAAGSAGSHQPPAACTLQPTHSPRPTAHPQPAPYSPPTAAAAHLLGGLAAGGADGLHLVDQVHALDHCGRGARRSCW
jgi:hypothetical protein